MHTKRLVSFTVAALLALGASIVACSSTTGGGATCDTVCGVMPDCGGTSCLSECLSLQAGCTESETAGKAGALDAFNDFANCAPAIVCIGGSYEVTNCPLPQIEITTRCAVTSVMITNPGMPDSGMIIFPSKDAASDSPVIIVGDDSGTDTGACGICQSDCQNDCGACSGGDCASSDDTGTVDSGCGVCQSNCEDDCGACSGGDCESTVDSGCGTCGTTCTDDCGDTCTGGSCCVSTGCDNCTTDCDDGISCDDNCGNACC